MLFTIKIVVTHNWTQRVYYWYST